MTTHAAHHIARQKRPAGHRIIAALSGAALLAGLVSATTPAAAAETPEPVLTYTFDDLTTAEDGSTVPNTGSGGRALDARIVGAGARLIDDGHGGQALAFPGGQAGTDAPHAVIGAGLIEGGQQDLSVLARIRWDDTQSGCRYPMTIGDSSARYLSYLAGCGRAEMRSEGSGPTAQNATIGSDVWTDLAIVLDGGASFSLYLDGELVGQVATDYMAEDLIGEGLSGWLAKSPFAVDPYFDGALDSMNVWDAALTPQQVAAQYDALSPYFVQQTIEGLDLGDLTSVTQNLSLPSSGPAGQTSISWQSSKPESLSPTGAVSRLDEDVSGVLTATVTRGTVTETVDFDFTVPAVTDPAAANERAAAAIMLPSVLASGHQLPARIAARPVSWRVASGDTEIADGQISAAPQEGLSPAVLQATVGTGADAATREFAVRIIEAEHATLAAYTTTKTTRGIDDPELERSVHLALSADGESYTPLNSGAGIVYATAVGQNEFDNGSKRALANPYLFRLRESEGFGVIALRTNVDGSRTDQDARSAIVFTTPDLVHFTEVGMLELSQDATVADVAAEWDAQLQAYRIVFADSSGGLSAVSTSDWETVTPLPDARILPGQPHEIDVEYAGQANLLPLTRAEADHLDDLLGRVHNNGLEEPEDIHVEVGGEFSLPETVTADYSDGQTHEFGVDWNQNQLQTVDTSEPGTYTVYGSLDWQPTVFPLVSGRADPHLYRYTDPDTGKRSWLYISTDENGQDDLYLRQAATIEGIRTAEDHKILGRGLTGSGGQIWAPEFHEIDGDVYVVFAANVAADYHIGNIEAHTMRLKPGQDPLQADSWEEPQRVLGTDGDYLADAGQTLTIDMTHARIGGTDYVIWNERTKVDADGSPSPSGSWAPAVLKIATVDISTSGPWQLTSPPTTISVPGYAWDYNTSPVDEGPFVIQRDGTIFVTFSGSGVDETYAVGLLSASAEADLLDSSSWHKRTYPIWSNEGPISNNWGPGHNAYVRNDDGELLNVFHARPTRTGARTSGVRMVYFRTDGSPILDMRDSEWLRPQNRSVAVTVTVGEGGEPPTDAPEPVLRYTFDSLEPGPLSEGVTIENTGTGGDTLAGTLYGQGATVTADAGTGTALTFPGGAPGATEAPYVVIPSGAIADGQEDVTLKARIRLGASSNNCQWPFMLGQSQTRYLFLTLGCGSHTYAEVRLEDHTHKAARNAVLQPGWHDVTVALDGGHALYYYLDGELVASTPTTLTAAQIRGDSRSGWLAKSPYGDAYFEGSIGEIAVYDQALVEVDDLWPSVLDRVPVSDGQHLRVHPDETRTLPLPHTDGLQWTSSDPGLIDAGTGAVTPPSSGQGEVTLTVTLHRDGQTRSRTYDLVVSQPTAEDPYGYLMVHFVEDAEGYAEKIYFDLSRGDDPTQWDRLNDGEPVLASDLGSTGVRDPYLVRNPKTGTYYLMATDLRVFGCQPYTTGGWYNDCSEHSTWYHGANLSREIVLWKSQDLVNWSDPWTLTVAQPDMGMAWAPEATWDEESERFVLYWSSKVYPSTRFPEQDPDEPGAYSQVHYGFTTDFATDFSYGGVMIDRGHDVIDTTIHQYGGQTYRISKDNGDPDTQVFMEVTDADRWWLPQTSWTTVATQIGRADYGAVEGPLIFKDNERESWYLFVDEYGGAAQGYRPYQVTGLGSADPQDISIEKMPLSGFDMLSTTKHGVVRPLTAAQYGTLRKADSVTGVESVEAETTVGTVPDLPETVTVTYADDRFGPSTAQREVQWQGVSEEAFAAEGTVTLSGIVKGVLPDNQFSATEAETLRAEATVTVTAGESGDPIDASVTTRCAAGSVTVVATATNSGQEVVDVAVISEYGERALQEIAAGHSASAAFLTRAEKIGAGSVLLRASSASADTQEVQVDYAAASCS